MAELSQGKTLQLGSNSGDIQPKLACDASTFSGCRLTCEQSGLCLSYIWPVPRPHQGCPCRQTWLLCSVAVMQLNIDWLNIQA